MKSDVPAVSCISLELQRPKRHDLRLQISVDEIDSMSVYGAVDRSQWSSSEAPAVAELEGVITHACSVDESQCGEEVLFDLLDADAAPPAENIGRSESEAVGRLIVIDAFCV